MLWSRIIPKRALHRFPFQPSDHCILNGHGTNILVTPRQVVLSAGLQVFRRRLSSPGTRFVGRRFSTMALHSSRISRKWERSLSSLFLRVFFHLLDGWEIPFVAPTGSPLNGEYFWGNIDTPSSLLLSLSPFTTEGLYAGEMGQPKLLPANQWPRGSHSHIQG